MMDYRTVPYEKLNSNIPKGRGMIKWMPFATMPEQYEAIQEMIEAQSLKKSPQLSSDVLEENERNAKEMIGQTVKLRYWSAGQEIMMECKLVSIDEETERIIVHRNNEILPIYFYHIYEITSSEYLNALFE